MSSIGMASSGSADIIHAAFMQQELFTASSGAAKCYGQQHHKNAITNMPTLCGVPLAKHHHTAEYTPLRIGQQ